MWAFDFPRRYEAEDRFVRSESPEADILQDISPGQRVAIWFHESGFIKGQFEGFQRSYALFFLVKRQCNAYSYQRDSSCCYFVNM
ncbi:hypothetical protein GCM10020331_042920 [Ectobacillus funiculus]